MRTIKTLLVIDDDLKHQEDVKDIANLVNPEWTVIAATNFAEARREITANPKADIILMDACLEEKRKVDTVSLVRELVAAGHQGQQIIADSSSSDYNRQLVEAGCTNAIQKWLIYKELKNLLT